MNREDGELISARAADLLKACDRSNAPRFTAFLTEGECALAQQTLERLHGSFAFFGGYAQAQRRILCVHPPEYAPEEQAYPIACVHLTYRRADHLTHRDVLGALMHLRLRRDAIGDILPQEGLTQVFLHKPVAQLVCDELRKIGRVGVRAELAAYTGSCVQEFEPIEGTVPSLRLDAVVSLAARISREKSAVLIHGGQVTVGGLPVLTPSALIGQDAVFSARGFGKFRLAQVSGITKKGRLHITIEKFK